MGRMHRTSNELAKAKKQLEELEETRDTERLLEIEEELKGLPRYGPEAAALKMEQEEIQERIKKRKEAAEELKNNELKQKADKAKTNKARDESANVENEKKNEKKNSTTRKSSNNVIHCLFLFCQLTRSYQRSFCLCLVEGLRPCHHRKTSWFSIFSIF